MFFRLRNVRHLVSRTLQGWPLLLVGMYNLDMYLHPTPEPSPSCPLIALSTCQGKMSKVLFALNFNSNITHSLYTLSIVIKKLPKFSKEIWKGLHRWMALKQSVVVYGGRESPVDCVINFKIKHEIKTNRNSPWGWWGLF